MLRVNVVTVQSGWILQKIAERIVQAGNSSSLGVFTLSHWPIRADVNFYCDVQNCFRGKTPTKDIGLFTHVHADDMGTVDPNTFKLDYIFHMCNRYRDMFKNYYSQDKMSLMVPWEIPNGFDLKKPRAGIFQRGKYEGKGYFFILDLFKLQTEVARKFHWTFVGNDWEGAVELASQLGIEAHHIKDSDVSYPNGYSKLYDEMDLVVIPSKWEGGPISLLEGMAKGSVILAPEVGWVPDYEHLYRFSPGVVSSLAGLLSSYILPSELRRESVIYHSYKKCAEQIVQIGERL